MGWRPLELIPFPAWLHQTAVIAGATRPLVAGMSVLHTFTSPVMFAGLLLVGHRFIVFRRWNDEIRQLPKFLAVFSVAVMELLIENYCVWWVLSAQLATMRSGTAPFPKYDHYAVRRVVAASNRRKYDASFVPLQDNIAIFFREWMLHNDAIKWLVLWRWSNIAVFLLVFLCICVSVLWDQVSLVFDIK
jgi:hypothetical protein